MSNMRFEAEARRLRLAGAIVDADLVTLRDAIESFSADAARHVMVDLTRVTELAPTAARYLLDVKAVLEAQGRRMTLLRLLDSPTDLAIRHASRRR